MGIVHPHTHPHSHLPLTHLLDLSAQLSFLHSHWRGRGEQLTAELGGAHTLSLTRLRRLIPQTKLPANLTTLRRSLSQVGNWTQFKAFLRGSLSSSGGGGALPTLRWTDPFLR